MCGRACGRGQKLDHSSFVNKTMSAANKPQSCCLIFCMQLEVQLFFSMFWPYYLQRIHHYGDARKWLIAYIFSHFSWRAVVSKVSGTASPVLFPRSIVCASLGYNCYSVWMLGWPLFHDGWLLVAYSTYEGKQHELLYIQHGSIILTKNTKSITSDGYFTGYVSGQVTWRWSTALSMFTLNEIMMQ